VAEVCPLGPLLVRWGEVILLVAPGRQWAALLLAAVRLASFDELVEALLGPGPPSARVCPQG
jgi:hypothetical protein